MLNLAKLPELKKKIWITLGLLALWRLGVHVPVPGIDIAKLSMLFKKSQSIFEIINLFSGGGLENFSIFALGIMPYISASIIFQLLTVSIPALKKIQEEGTVGRNKINQWTRYATVLLTIFQGSFIAMGLVDQGYILPNQTGFFFIARTVLTLAAGTSLVMWLAEQITEKGIGNGISLVIFSGIVARFPAAISQAWAQRDDFFGPIGFVLVMGFAFLLISAIIYFERCQRRIPVHYAKRSMVGPGASVAHLPMKINNAGVVPPIFASALLVVPASILQFLDAEWARQISALLTNGWIHDVFYAVAIIFFTYFYTAVSFNPTDLAEMLQKNGGFVPGIRPGKPTSDYLDTVLTRVTFGGAMYILAICLLPQFLTSQFDIPQGLAYALGGTSLLIVVGTAMDTIAQLETHLISRNYDGFLGAKGGRFKGRKS